MKNHILNLGKVLTKTQQKQINGGRCQNAFQCWEWANFFGPEDAYACIDGNCGLNPGPL
ncbi:MULTISPECIES: hypothetical protein [Aquimarina]|uniref:hypothetical protein n=1 Tax=Aquimarina TaxID=290174 RepID=UPI00131EE3BA|nr:MULTISPECIES: hypothetical protein [Aquimarina]